MKLPSKQLRTWLGTWLVVAIVGAALATGSAFAQRAGTSTPSPNSPSVGAGTAAPPTPLGNPPSVGAGTAASPTPLGNGVVTPTTPPAQTPTGGGDVAGLPGFDSAFEQADANHDGRLTQDEFNTAWTIYTRQP